MTDHTLPVDLAAAHALILSLTDRVATAEAHATAARDEIENARRAVRVEQAASEAAKVDAGLAKAARISLELEIEQLKFQIAKLKKERFGASSEHGAKLDQLALALEDLQESAAELDEVATIAEAAGAPSTLVRAFERPKPARRPLPDHLPRHRLVHPAPSTCACCGGGLRKLGEAVTESLERAPARWFVVQHVREKMSCARCEAITEAPAPFHAISRGRAGPGLLAEIVFGKFGMHLPLTRQSRAFANEGVDLDVSTMADWVGAVAANFAPLIAPMVQHALAGKRIHATTRRCRCSRRVRPAPVGSGWSCATTVPSAGRVRRSPSTSTRLIDAASIRKASSAATPGCCRPTPTRASDSCTNPVDRAGPSSKQPAGRMADGSSSRSRS